MWTDAITTYCNPLALELMISVICSGPEFKWGLRNGSHNWPSATADIKCSKNHTAQYKYVTHGTKRYYPSSWLVELTETMPIHDQNNNFPVDCSNQGHTKHKTGMLPCFHCTDGQGPSPLPGGGGELRKTIINPNQNRDLKEMPCEYKSEGLMSEPPFLV
jgi:hypothetical protein